jgi:uncharacterized protein (DUF58 family)
MSASLRVVLVLLALSLVGSAVSGQVIYARLAYLWVFLIGSSYVIAKVGLDRIELHRIARVDRSEVGQVFEEVFEIHNRSWFPRLWIEVRDQSTLPGGGGSRVLTLIGGRRSRSFVSRTRLIARGVYELGPTELRSGDLFGLFSSKLTFSSDQYLMVYPRLIELAGLPNPPGLLPGGEAVRRRTHQITPNAATVREYATGDPISRIHWPSVARRNKLIVKEFELDPLAEIWIFVDAARFAHAKLDFNLEADPGSIIFQKGGTTKLIPSTEEYAATITASLARHYLRVGRSVGYAAAGSDLAILPAERGGRQMRKIIENTALFRADGETRFADLVLGQARHLPRGSTVYLISPTVDLKMALLCEQLRRLGQRALVILLDAASFGGKPGSRELNARLSTLGIATVAIGEGQPLAEAFVGLRLYSYMRG